MARDYRYGHKQKQVVARRSQEDSTILKQQVPTSIKETSALTRAARKRQSTPKEQTELPLVSTPPVPPENIEAIDAPTGAPVDTPTLVAEPEEPKAAPKKKTRKKSKIKTDVTEPEVKKEEETPTPSVDANTSSDSGLAVDDPDDDEPVTKKKFFWWKLTSLVILLVSVTGWLVYAPLILAFALKMGWIDEDTRARWDSRESRQPQVAFVEQVLPDIASDVEKVKKEEAVIEVEPEVNFTFYEELPKAEVQLSAEPLPVKTRAPVYLQLSSFHNLKEANDERTRLTQQGYLSKINQRINSNGKSIYILRMGPYDDQRELNRLKVELQKLGIDAREVLMTSVIKEQEKNQERLQDHSGK